MKAPQYSVKKSDSGYDLLVIELDGRKPVALGLGKLRAVKQAIEDGIVAQFEAAYGAAYDAARVAQSAKSAKKPAVVALSPLQAAVALTAPKSGKSAKLVKFTPAAMPAAPAPAPSVGGIDLQALAAALASLPQFARK